MGVQREQKYRVLAPFLLQQNLTTALSKCWTIRLQVKTAGPWEKLRSLLSTVPLLLIIIKCCEYNKMAVLPDWHRECISKCGRTGWRKPR